MNDSQFIIDVTAENLQSVLQLSHQTPVLVDFWAPWCEPCKMLLPIVEKLAREYQGQFILAKVNIDEQQALAGQFGVRSVPTVKMVRDSQLRDEFSGALPEAEVRAFIERHIDNASDRVIDAAMTAYSQGQSAEAEQLLRDAMTMEPVNYRAHLTLGELLARDGRSEEAQQLLAALPADVGADPAAQSLRARLTFATAAADAPPLAALQEALAANPKDSAARYQLAMRLIMEGEYEAALQQLLELVRRDRGYGDDAGRKAMLQVFELLGGEGELVGHYRRQMFTAMH